jgi:hypothetical protein
LGHSGFYGNKQTEIPDVETFPQKYIGGFGVLYFPSELPLNASDELTSWPTLENRYGQAGDVQVLLDLV